MNAKIFLRNSANEVVDENVEENIGSRIQRIRKHFRLTQKNFASKVGVTQAYLSEIELNKKTPSESVLLSLSNAYDIDYGWLTEGESNSRQEKLPGTQQADSTVNQQPGVNMIPLFKRLPHDFHGYNDSHQSMVAGYVSYPEAPPGSCALVVRNDCFNIFSADDYAIFVCGAKPESGDLVVAKDEWGDAIIRQFREKNGEHFLTTGNPGDPPTKIDDDSIIVGKIVDGVRRVKF